MAASNKISSPKQRTVAAGESGDVGTPQSHNEDDVKELSNGLGRLAIKEEDEMVPPLAAPRFLPLPPAKYTCVAFDLETTGLGANAEITQVAAIYKEKTFNRYVMPIGEITAGASQVTKLTKRDGMLCHDGKPVETVNIGQCLTEFSKFLSCLDKPILLYGHNSRVFDCPLLVAALSRCDLISSFSAIVSGFGDTLRVFKSVLPGRKSYKQEDLVRTVLNTTYEAHDALEDVRTLQALCETIADDDVMRQHSFDISDVKLLSRQQDRMASLEEMIKGKVISKYMAEKIAKSGLTRDDLVNCYSESREEGVIKLLSADVAGKPRVTKNKDILTSIVAYLKDNSK